MPNNQTDTTDTATTGNDNMIETTESVMVEGGYILDPAIDNNASYENAVSGASTQNTTSSGGSATVITNTGRGPRNSGIYPAPPGGADRGPLEGGDDTPIVAPLPEKVDLILHNVTGAYLNKNAVVCIENNLQGGSRVTMWDGRFYDFALPPSAMADKIGNTLDVTKNAAADTFPPTSGSTN